MPKLLTFLVMAKADGLSPEEVLEGISALAEGREVRPKPKTAIEWEAHHSQTLHNAYVAWLHQED